MSISHLDYTKSTFFHAVSMIKSSFTKVFPIAFALGAAEQLLISLSPPSIVDGQLNASGGFLLIAILLLLVASFCNGLMMVTLLQAVQNRPMAWKDRSRFVFGRYGSLIAGSFLFNIGLGFSLLLFKPLALIFGTVFFLYLPFMLFDKRPILFAFADSFQAARARFITHFILFVTYAFVYYAPKLLIPQILLAFPNLFAVDKVLLVFATGISLPICFSITVTLYSMGKREQLISKNEA